jgi:murein DD-endopeptidase MepM/ murein hydrolase activator NlpD
MKSTVFWLGMLLAITGATAYAQDSARQDLAGTWQGTLGTGTRQLHLVLTISAESGRVYKGELDSKDQHAILSMENITLAGDAVQFEVGQVGGVYVGTMSKDHDEIVGTWTQRGVPAQPLSFKREPEQPSAEAKESAPKTPGGDQGVVPIDVSIPTPPIAFKADGRWDLAYELRIASFADTGEVTITRIDILDSNQKPLVSMSGETLKAAVDPEAAVGLKLGPRTFTTIYMWLSASSLDEIPRLLRHRITIKASDEPTETSTLTPSVPLDRKPVIISPPLRGENWLAANGPSNTSVHRRAILPVEGRASIGQRFAIDWAQVYPDGEVYRGDKLNNRSYRCYGQPVYAVADGIITEVKDGIPENTPGPTSRAVDITFETVAGNHIIEQIEEGTVDKKPIDEKQTSEKLFATFAHMQPGSLRVKLGDHVHQGQILGLLGNSGNSTAPHLHFQICNANSVLGCEGLPYAFDSFEVQGRWKPEGPVSQHAMEIPTEGEIVKFTAAQ